MAALLHPAAMPLYPRDEEPKCVLCDTSVQLVCPECTGNTQCQFITPTNCFECPRATCVPIEPIPAQPSQKSGANVGAIVGGVVGGLAALAIITYLVWRFCVRTRRQPLVQDETWEAEAEESPSGEKTYAQRRDYRASTHTVHSIASTVLTRASNIIQIAYIPGVTNRATANDSVLVPPVPPIPASHSAASSPNDDQHFFIPANLRDSTYSGLSSFSDRTSYARTSYAPRSSVASTIYGKNVVIAPAQTGMRAKPAMVSVRSARSNNSNKDDGSATPPVPAVDYDKYAIARPPSPANSTFSVGSTFLNNANTHTATPARAMVVRVGSVKKITQQARQPTTKPSSSSLSASSSDDVDILKSPTTVSGSTVRDSTCPTIIVDSPAVDFNEDQGPFSDPPPNSATPSTASLSAVIEEATRRASQRDSSMGSRAGPSRERSPFGDEHATG
ncbi:uncharacterized protein CTHT_0051650 [Thermochaetoides thermophila DSM 1495]|uniref:Membrane anchor Opy2 N-terminal domain-containing protein n=1 Tax=Chaetomium thermophilum (strain DSM 1495 / CBS 144.50 / IMI 039719) TaxID=759272 RepID=G0SDG0_CHATD|nr:hypothetical protein CTHT_0051650 [Thermochaetoides thermophila DSM 1495]EGS18561.1 hypothetical protein CTHT_0051650 [Thermochaetoides thermophila DSM 1495]